MLRGFKQTLCAPGPRGPTESEAELRLSVSFGGTGQQWTAAEAGALGAADVGMALVFLKEITINPTTELPELTQDWEIDSWRAQQNLVHQDPGERSSPHKRLDPDFSRSVQESPQRRGSVVACCRLGGTECGRTCPGSFEGGHHYLHHLHHSLAPGK